MVRKLPARPPAADESDRIIGRKIREKRLLAGYSQTQLGNLLGITFQQVQKYEKGANRVATKTLIRIAKHLGVGVMTLIQDVVELEKANPGRHHRDIVSEVGQSREGAELARMWSLIGAEKRELLVRIARGFADETISAPIRREIMPDKAPQSAAGSASRPQLP